MDAKTMEIAERLWNAITCNGCREMTETRFKQAIAEVTASMFTEQQMADAFGAGENWALYASIGRELPFPLWLEQYRKEKQNA